METFLLCSANMGRMGTNSCDEEMKKYFHGVYEKYGDRVITEHIIPCGEYTYLYHVIKNEEGSASCPTPKIQL